MDIANDMLFNFVRGREVIQNENEQYTKHIAVVSSFLSQNITIEEGHNLWASWVPLSDLAQLHFPIGYTPSLSEKTIAFQEKKQARSQKIIERSFSYASFTPLIGQVIGFIDICRSIQNIWQFCIANEGRIKIQSEQIAKEAKTIIETHKFYQITLSTKQRLAILALSISVFVRGIITFCGAGIVFLPLDLLGRHITWDKHSSSRRISQTTITTDQLPLSLRPPNFETLKKEDFLPPFDKKEPQFEKPKERTIETPQEPVPENSPSEINPLSPPNREKISLEDPEEKPIETLPTSAPENSPSEIETSLSARKKRFPTLFKQAKKKCISKIIDKITDKIITQKPNPKITAAILDAVGAKNSAARFEYEAKQRTLKKRFSRKIKKAFHINPRKPLSSTLYKKFL